MQVHELPFVTVEEKILIPWRRDGLQKQNRPPV
jgi:hypothetical protein